jgi:hypothetical protein
MEKNMKKEPRCIICGQEKDGIQIKEDNVIRAMRWFNRKIMKRERNFKLVVCKDCYMKYSKARKSYQKKQVTYLVIGVLFAALLIAVSEGNIFAVVYGLVIILVMYGLSLISYVPALDVQKKGPLKKELQQNESGQNNSEGLKEHEKHANQKIGKRTLPAHKKVYKHE